MNLVKMDAEKGGYVVHRSRRTGMLAVVIAVQNLLVIGCLVVTLYVYWNFKAPQEDVNKSEDVYIQIGGIQDFLANKTLKLSSNDVKTSKMEIGDDNETIRIQCGGPYIFYLEVCYRSIQKGKTKILQLQENKRKDPVCSFTLDDTSPCSRFHSTVYLKAKDEASMYVYSLTEFKIYNMTIGLSYLLGTGKCDF